MGFTNFVIIDDLNLIIEISRYASDECDYPIDLAIPNLDKEVLKLTVIDIGEIINYAHKVPFADEYDDFLFIWLKSRGITYKVLSEHNIDLKHFESQGYKICRIKNE